MHHLLVTNDFPPKVGGIQTYLWELWRRLPAGSATVLTTAHAGSEEFDAAQGFRVIRTRQRVLLPTPGLARHIDSVAADVGAGFVVLDPAIPLGLLGPRLHRPYALVLHGSELAGRIPVGSALLGRTVRGATHVVAAGTYPASEARRVAGDDAPPITIVPPGVDLARFRPVTRAERDSTRDDLGLSRDAPVVVGISRLVPRKGFDVLIAAAAKLVPRHPDLIVAIASTGRDRARLERLARASNAPVRFLGRVSDELLPRVYAAGDVFAMLCRGNRWFGLEQEGFGIVFLEAAACGVPQVAGSSGGAADAVVDGVTGVVVPDPTHADAVVTAIDALLNDGERRERMGAAARERAVAGFSYDTLAMSLSAALEGAARS